MTLVEYLRWWADKCEDERIGGPSLCVVLRNAADQLTQDSQFQTANDPQHVVASDPLTGSKWK